MAKSDKSSKRKSSRKRQNLGYLLGAIACILFLTAFLWPGQESFHIYGPPNTGHENLACSDCHEQAVGSPAQQINANVRYYLGLRQSPVDFVHKDVGNATCQSCHERPNDRHPVFRFEEARFSDARAAIAPEQCVSCHVEHTGVRVNIELTYCVYCHEDVDLQEEPLDVSHKDLAETGNWESCLACHDFHGNHEYDVPDQMDEAFAIEAIQIYFGGGESPYSDNIIYPAKEERPINN